MSDGDGCWKWKLMEPVGESLIKIEVTIKEKEMDGWRIWKIWKEGPRGFSYDELEEIYRKNVGNYHTQIYAADMQFSMMSPAA